MSRSSENLQTDGKTDGRTVFYRTLLAETGCPIKLPNITMIYFDSYFPEIAIKSSKRLQVFCCLLHHETCIYLKQDVFEFYFIILLVIMNKKQTKKESSKDIYCSKCNYFRMCLMTISITANFIMASMISSIIVIIPLKT